MYSSSPQSMKSKNSQDFWFYDGSIILQVEDVRFRVHQTVLASHSELFAEMFTLPQPCKGEEEEDVEGCSVLHLPDVPVDDLRDLLSGVYCPSHFDKLSVDDNLETTLNFISGILRLGTKWGFRALREQCIAVLTSKFPTSFHDYTLRATTTSPSSKRYRTDSLMRAINLAQETNIPSILPFAYYCLARLPLKRILKHPSTDVSWHIKTICLVGRERLRAAEISLSHTFLILFQPSPSCRSPHICGFERSPHAEWHIHELEKAPHPLRAYTRWACLNVCGECVAAAQGQHLAGRVEVWERLPDFFGLLPWDELQKEQSR